MKAISVVPSGNWRGSTGPWSTFSLRIGNPPQGVEVLPATSKSNVWVVDPLICPGVQAAGTCRDFRGGLFESQNSTTFNEIITDDDYRELPFLPEQSLGYNGTATFGFDVVGLDLQDGDSAELPNQTISAFAWTTPFLATGLLGLSDESLDVLGPTDNHSSPLSTFRGANRIPSLFWAYNAGARYLEPRVPASLTVGGYDLNRGGKLEDAFKVPISRSPARDLVVSIQAISIGNGESQEIEPGIDAYIDSVVPDLWLPESICRRFEDAFALQWDETAQLYLLDEEHLSQLYASDSAKVSLTLADPYDKSQTTVISLPFQAFDFDVTWPLAGIQGDSVLHYFPLKRANDSSQYYLGHAFLQEA